jgi:RNA polymerase sigma factor
MTQAVDAEGLLKEAKLNNDAARESLIHHYKPFIINTIGHICKRFVTWSDEEASIGLIAFNQAIATYMPDGGRTFTSYVYLVMKRRIIDYYRKEKGDQLFSLDFHLDDDEVAATSFEIKKSIESYKDTADHMELVDEILELDGQLQQFGLSFEELEEASPKHRDTRLHLMEMARSFIRSRDLVDSILQKKKFPGTAFAQKCGYHIKTIERYRKYLITLVLIQLHPQWIHLAAFIQGNKEGVQ